MRSLGLGPSAAIFGVAAIAIWIAGTRLERVVDVIARRTGLGQAFSGMLLLAAATSLPEVATTITAVAILDDPTLAVHNLLGGVAMQTAIIGIADAAKGRRGALTFFAPRFVLLIQGVGLVLLLQVTVGAIAAKGVPSFGPVSIWAIVLAACYGGLMYLVYRDRGYQRWTPARSDDVPAELEEEASASEGEREDDEEDSRSTTKLWLAFAGLSVVVLCGGYVATESAEILAKKTGLGSAFVGATLLAIATSLPEISTTISAVRNDRHTAAISNVFGSNAFDVALLVLAEALHAKGTIFAHAEGTVIFVASVGTAMTCVYLWGLLERTNRTVLGIGLDSVIALVGYASGMVVLYFIQ